MENYAEWNQNMQEYEQEQADQAETTGGEALVGVVMVGGIIVLIRKFGD